MIQNKLHWISHIILEWLIPAVQFLWDESDYIRPPFCSPFGTCVVICCGKMSQNMIIKFELRKSNSLSSITGIFSRRTDKITLTWFLNSLGFRSRLNFSFIFYVIISGILLLTVISLEPNQRQTTTFNLKFQNCVSKQNTKCNT